MTSLFRAAFVVLLAVVVAACGEVREPIRIGSQDFPEQKLLAEMMALLAEQAGADVERAIPYGENRKSLEAIQRGVLDAYPEYDGTILVLSGSPALNDPAAAAIAARVPWSSPWACAGWSRSDSRTVSRSPCVTTSRSAASWSRSRTWPSSPERSASRWTRAT